MSELGIRYKCYKCEMKFYDLNRPQPICPSCGEDQSKKTVDQPFGKKKKRSSYKEEPEIHGFSEDGEELVDLEDRGASADPMDSDALGETDEEEREKDELDHDDYDENALQENADA